MKYWIFQSNQVLGPYEPDDLSRHSSFGAESLVCPEGRRGTSMGDWQRAGMVPDLSVALVRAAQSNGAQGSVATLAGLPPEPTLKDLAVLGSLQEKMAMLEDVALQLQEGLRAKDAELAALRQELAGKDRQSSVMKSAMEREAAELQEQTNEFKRKMAELEERVGAVNRLSETIDKAVGAAKNVEHDVETHGATLTELTKEIEALQARMNERLSAAPPAPLSAPPPAAPPVPQAMPQPAPELASPNESHSEMIELPEIAPAPAPFAAARPPEIELAIPSGPPDAAPSPAPPESSPFPAFGAREMSSFDAPGPEIPVSIPMDPMAGSYAQGASSAAAPAIQPAAAAVAPAPAQAGGRKKALIFGGLCGLIALGALAFVSGGMGKKKASMTPSMPDPAPLPTPTITPPAGTEPAPVPAIDPREAAIEAAKEWTIPGGRKLGQALETLSPPIGNLSPWMAEPLGNDRVSVNYFAHGGGAGAPTVAYEFEVNLQEKTVAGRNPAAKAVIAGKASPPPAPPKAKRVTLKPKRKAKAPKAKPKEENLDSLLGSDSLAAPKTEASLAGPAAPSDASPKDASAAGEDAPPAPAKPKTAKRAAKASAQSAPAAQNGKAADETLLDDILKE